MSQGVVGALSALDEALADRRDGSAAVADRLCRVCVDVLDVDGAALSLMLTPEAAGTFAADSRMSREVDALQFVVGEGPCYETVVTRRPVLVNDLRDRTDTRFPAFADAAARYGVRAVFAMPVMVNAGCIGALNLIRCDPGPLGDAALTAGLRAAELAALPLLDLMGEVDVATVPEHSPTADLRSLGRIEIYQATGMLMSQLGVDSTEALARLRAHAYAEGRPASEVAWAIVERRLVLDPDSRETS